LAGMKSRAVCWFKLALVLAALLSRAVAFGQAYPSVDAFPGLIFSNALCLASPPAESNRLFVVEKHGRIVVITNLASPTRTLFLDISARVTVGTDDEANDLYSEEGLTG